MTVCLLHNASQLECGMRRTMFLPVAGKQIPGDTGIIANYRYQTSAQAIIVIEKV